MESNEAASKYSGDDAIEMDSSRTKHKVMKNIQKQVSFPCDQVWVNLRVRIRSTSGNGIERKVSDVVSHQVVNLVTNRMVDHVRYHVRDHVRYHVRYHVRDYVRDHVRDYVRDHVAQNTNL